MGCGQVSGARRDEPDFRKVVDPAARGTGGQAASVRRVAQGGAGYFAAHADADAARPAAGRLYRAGGISDQAAERRVSDDATRPFAVRAAVQSAGMGRRQSRFHQGRAKRSDEHTSELQSLMRISYAVLCLTKKKNTCNT